MRRLSGVVLCTACCLIVASPVTAEQKPAPPPGTPAPVLPDTTITSGPTGGAVSTTNTPTFTYVSSMTATIYTCTVDGGAPFQCNDGTYTTDALADGAHVFTVYATDSAGDNDPSPAVAAFTVDTRGPSRISIITREAHVSPDGLTTVVLACSSGLGPCTGTLTLTKQLVVHVSHARVTRSTFRLGRATFTLDSGARKSVRLTLTRTARRLLAASKNRNVVIRTTATTDVNTSRPKVDYTLR